MLKVESIFTVSPFWLTVAGKLIFFVFPWRVKFPETVKAVSDTLALVVLSAGFSQETKIAGVARTMARNVSFMMFV